MKEANWISQSTTISEQKLWRE